MPQGTHSSDCSSRCPAALLAVVALSTLIAGCAGDPVSQHVTRGSDPEVARSASSVVVSAAQVWTDTDYTIRNGQTLTITASGDIIACDPAPGDLEAVAEVGPEGTYLFNDDAVDRQFPLPAGSQGPAPCYSLIGRIGDGDPFFVGRGRSITADRSGPLQLGINDYDVSDNAGQFLVDIDLTGSERPVLHERVIDGRAASGRPEAGSSVVIFYLDGLRPDVVREMAAMGHLPQIRRHFLDGGSWLSSTFTAFPSDTITSNGTMWTGCFSDRHGIKGQVNFSRRRLSSASNLDPFGPQRTAQWLSPQGVDKVVQQSQAAAVGLFQGAEGREAWLEVRQSSVPPLYELLQNHGENWAVGVLPVMTEVPPPLWSRSLTRQMPYFQTHRAWEYMDDANADYAVKNLLARREKVTIIWLPETDTCSHKNCRGQFGLTRRTIARADQLLGNVVDELAAQGRLESTYLMLVSDHGHVGGRDTHLSQFDLATDFFFHPRRVNQQGEWTGGGLGLSVRMHRYDNRHPEDSSKEFVFIDGDSDGAARIFLPRGRYRSQDWSAPSRPGDLLQYRLGDGREAVDLPRSLASIQAMHGDGSVRSPIDLVLMKLTDDSLLITTSDRGQAVIERRPGATARWEYRYSVVRNVRPNTDGSVDYELSPSPATDPLQLTACYTPAFLATFHDERTWLEITAETDYPDAVVALSRHVLWDDALRACEQEYGSDLVVTARPGWYFGMEGSPGTMHGYPLRDAARAAWFVAGPGVRRGARITTPARLADLTPTILDIVGLWDETASTPQTFDGRPVRDIYESQAEYLVYSQPVYWDQVDLQAWRPLEYRQLSSSALLPRSINRPGKVLDLNNIAYGVATIPDLSVFRIMDDVVSPLSGGRQPVSTLVERTESFFRRRPDQVVAQGARVPDVTGVSLADYSLTSQGNLQRVDRAIDWVQDCGELMDEQLASPLRMESMPLTRPVNLGVDAAQYTFWETYRFGQRVIIKLVDETVLNNIEHGADRALNGFRRIPNEIAEDDDF